MLENRSGNLFLRTLGVKNFLLNFAENLKNLYANFLIKLYLIILLYYSKLIYDDNNNINLYNQTTIGGKEFDPIQKIIFM